MAVEILSVLQQVRFRVVTTHGEYQDALYLPQGIPLDLPVLTAQAQARADAWMLTVLNSPSGEVPVLEDLTTQLEALTQQQAAVEAKIALVIASQEDTEAPGVPQGLTVTTDGKTVLLTWLSSVKDDPTLAGYLVLRDGEVIGKTAETQYKDIFTPKAQPLYTLIAYDYAGNQSERTEAVGLMETKG